MENKQQENDKPEPKTKADKRISDAIEAANRLQEQNDRMEALIARQEALAIDRTLSGKAEAGQPEVKPKEETPEEYAKRVMSNAV